MLAKKNRATEKEINEIFSKSRFLSSPQLSFRYFFNEKTNPPKISFLVSKKVAPKAVTRNLLKRRGFGVVGPRLKDLPGGLVGVFVFNKGSVLAFGANNKNINKRKEAHLLLKNEIQKILKGIK